MRYFHDGRPAKESLDRIDAIAQILTSGGRSLAEGALCWLLTRSERTIPIPGIRTVAQAEQNAGALRHGPLTTEQLAEIDRLLER